MEGKEYHIGKTVPEMIAELERHQENHRLWTKKFCLVQIANAIDEIDNKNNKDKDQETEQYKLIRYCVQRLLKPNPVKNFRTMAPYEELIEHYNTRMYYYDVWKQHEAKKAKKTSTTKPVDRKLFQNVGNRVKTTVNGLFESMKKNNRKEEHILTSIISFPVICINK